MTYKHDVLFKASNVGFLFAVSDLKNLLGDLFVAGSETTASTIRWAIYYLAKYPEIQAKVHKEIDSVVDRDILPSIQQKNR